METRNITQPSERVHAQETYGTGMGDSQNNNTQQRQGWTTQHLTNPIIPRCTSEEPSAPLNTWPNAGNVRSRQVQASHGSGYQYTMPSPSKQTQLSTSIDSSFGKPYLSAQDVQQYQQAWQQVSPQLKNNKELGNLVLGYLAERLPSPRLLLQLSSGGDFSSGLFKYVLQYCQQQSMSAPEARAAHYLAMAAYSAAFEAGDQTMAHELGGAIRRSGLSPDVMPAAPPKAGLKTVIQQCETVAESVVQQQVLHKPQTHLTTPANKAEANKLQGQRQLARQPQASQLQASQLQTVPDKIGGLLVRTGHPFKPVFSQYLQMNSDGLSWINGPLKVQALIGFLSDFRCNFGDILFILLHLAADPEEASLRDALGTAFNQSWHDTTTQSHPQSKDAVQAILADLWLKIVRQGSFLDQQQIVCSQSSLPTTTPVVTRTQPAGSGLLADTATPDMKILRKIVIPNVSHEWEQVHDFLDMGISSKRTIKDNQRGDPKKCMVETFEQWLTGDGKYPKTWKTLVEALGEISDLASATVQIKRELANKGIAFR